MFRNVINKMTLEEKAGFLTGKYAAIAGNEMYDFDTVAFVDGPNGVRAKIDAINGQSCVAYPTASALGASWDREVCKTVGACIAEDCKMLQKDVVLAPGVNMKRTPHCGRNFEYYSEDPVLSGELAASFIIGVQESGVGTSVKHYAANNQEFERLFINADVDERTLREYYLRVFQIVLKYSDPETVMCAYNKINGVHCSENKFLLTDILRDEWNYGGAVLSDWGSVHDTAKAIHAGLDIEMPYNKNMTEQLREGLASGRVTEEEINQAVERVFRMSFKLRELKKCKTEPYDRQRLHAEAQNAAAECITVLKNTDNVLPIKSDKYKKVLVVGRLAEEPLIGGSGAAKIEVSSQFIDKPLDYITRYCQEQNITVAYDGVYQHGFMGAEDVAKINSMSYNEYDAIIVFVGDNYGADTETEYWDRDSVVFSNYMNGMATAAANKCDNVIVVMQTGSATIPVRWNQTVKGIVQMWYAGEGGGKAIADILFGKVNPSAKLSETFVLKDRTDMDTIGDGFKTLYAEGLSVGYRYYDKNPADIWFPFGHGLSYTTFEYSNLSMSKTTMDDLSERIEVRCKVRNTGNTAGKEVVQLYIHQEHSIVTKPYKELKHFEKVYLEPGEEKEVQFILEAFDFEYFNLSLHKFHVESGEYHILVGASSEDIRLKQVLWIHNQDSYTIPKPSFTFYKA